MPYEEEDICMPHIEEEDTRLLEHDERRPDLLHLPRLFLQFLPEHIGLEACMMDINIMRRRIHACHMRGGGFTPGGVHAGHQHFI